MGQVDKQISDGNLQLPPLRSLNDFILDSARFQLPNLKDFEKWGNRVVNNLLYYQTNYFFIAVIIFVLIGLMHPGKMLVGIAMSGLIIFIYAYFATKATPFASPIARVIFTLTIGGLIFYTLGSLLVFLLGILLPISVIFIHASLRLRSLKNKLVNKIEVIGLKRTPMGIFLEQLGMEPEFFD